MHDFERLGLFYLGRHHDLATGTTGEEPLLYESRDLVTHAVAVGMTGSGKTGLCLSLVEEAAIDGVPVIAIDPKGDLSNLLLTFPSLTPAEFEPWVSPDEARSRGLSVPEFAAQQAETWRKGLADWGQDGARIQRLREAAEVAVYTPGSGAGLPVSILASFAAPPASVLEDGELTAERVRTTVTSLLALAGIESDPSRGREHILLATLLGQAWREGRNLDLAGLVQAVQSPPIGKVGVFDLDTFYPPADRFELALQLNALLAAPGFESWLQGEPLDVDRLLYTPAGRPRVAIFSIAHLGDRERMFFVSLLLNQVLTWMRGQRGTSSLRAVLYMDEIFGFFPPVANPPSKTPLLTLLKQARAFGVGVVLATQNPVDLDYKGLANTGTWFLGRLQTERDKARVLEGLEGAAANAGEAFDRARMEQQLAALGSRVFLLHNVHEREPVVFRTRWAMSYLRGPLGRDEIRTLMAPMREALAAGPGAAAPAVPAAPAGASTPALGVPFGAAPPGVMPPGATPSAVSPAASGHAPTVSSRPESAAGPAAPMARTGAGMRPILPPAVEQYFAPAGAGALPEAGSPAAGRAGSAPAPATGLAQGGPGVAGVPELGSTSLTYVPMLYGAARVGFTDARLRVDATRDVVFVTPVADAAVAVDWQRAFEYQVPPDALSREPADRSAGYEPLPAAAANAANHSKWSKEFTQWLGLSQQLDLLRSPRLKLASSAGESERDFRIRLQSALREERDRATDGLRRKFAPKIASLTERLRRAEQAVARESEQARQQKVQTAVSVGATLLGAFLGRKAVSASTLGRATTAVRGAGRTMKEMTDIERARETADALRQQLGDLEARLEADLEAVAAGFDPTHETLEPVALKPKRTQITVQLVALVWVPVE